MRKIYILIFFFPFFFNFCSDQSSNDILDDEEILNLVYSDYKFPEDFYTEELNDGSPYYMNTISITPPDQRENSWFELSTNSRDTAFYWSELSCQNSSYYRSFESERETEKYFEFRRVSETNPSDVVLFRAHKLSYLVRSMYDLFHPGSIIGVYKERPFFTKNIKELIEYLIFVRNYNNGSYKVLKSYTEVQIEQFVHSITELIIIHGDWGIHDEINVWEKQYLIDKETGDITVKSELIKTIQGHLN